jgi:hypothetical protein
MSTVKNVKIRRNSLIDIVESIKFVDGLKDRRYFEVVYKRRDRLTEKNVAADVSRFRRLPTLSFEASTKFSLTFYL